MYYSIPGFRVIIIKKEKTQDTPLGSEDDAIGSILLFFVYWNILGDA